jgi:hypothetical protein
MPPLREFLPPMTDVSLPPLEDFTARLGLPQWSELGLPPIEKLLESTGGPETLKVSNVMSAMKHADAAMTKLVYGLLPPDLKAAARQARGRAWVEAGMREAGWGESRRRPRGATSGARGVPRARRGARGGRGH